MVFTSLGGIKPDFFSLGVMLSTTYTLGGYVDFFSFNLAKPPCKTTLGGYLDGFVKVRGLKTWFCSLGGDVIHH